MKKIRVLVTTSTFPRNKNDSMPRLILTLSKCIVASGDIECLVSAPHSPGTLLSEEMEGIKIERYRYMFPYSLEKISGMGIISKIRSNKLLLFIVPSLLMSQLLSTASLVRKYKPDVILSNWIVPQGLVAAVLKLFYPTVKVILVSHGGDAGFIQSHYLLSLFCKYALIKADRVIAVSSFIRDIILNISGSILDKLSVIPYGIDLTPFEGAHAKKADRNGISRKGLLFVGRLEEKKGVQYLIESMPRVLEMHPDMTLTIAGDGTLKRQLMNLAENLHIEDRVIFVGHVQYSQLVELFGETVLFIAPSINTKEDVEGLPNAILEAIGAKVPVITTDAGGITDIIENNVTGVLVQQGRSDQLAEKIVELMGNQNLRATLAENAYRKLLTDYTYPQMGRKYREVILQTVQRG
jgi:glycosyltransferase involved in cell wall biosynthesis